MTTVRVPCGACVMKQSEKNFKKKPCKLCGEYFKPKFPGEKYCSDGCRDLSQATMRKELYPEQYKKKQQKTEEYNQLHHFCPLCGEPILDGRQNVHFDCVLKKWRKGERPKWVRKFFENRGYRMKEVDELANEERSV